MKDQGSRDWRRVPDLSLRRAMYSVRPGGQAGLEVYCLVTGEKKKMAGEGV